MKAVLVSGDSYLKQELEGRGLTDITSHAHDSSLGQSCDLHSQPDGLCVVSPFQTGQGDRAEMTGCQRLRGWQLMERSRADPEATLLTDGRAVLRVE